MFILLVIFIGMAVYLEDCYRTVPPEFRVVPPRLAWLIELPFLLAMLNPLGLLFLPIVNGIISFTLVYSYQRLANARDKYQGPLFWGWVGAVNATFFMVIFFAASIVAYVVRQERPLDPPDWVQFFESPGGRAIALILCYGIFIVAMMGLRGAVKKDLDEDVRQQRLSARRPVGRKAKVADDLKSDIP